MSELKPCPFCGCDEIEIIGHDHIGDIPYEHHSIDCASCECSMEVDGPIENINLIWNNRQSTNEQLQELCKALLSAQAHCHSVLADDGHKELLDEIERLKAVVPMFNRQAH